MQNAIKDERLKSGDNGKSQMQTDSDPLQVVYAHYTESPDVNMIEAIEGLRVRFQKIRIVDGPKMQVNMVGLGEDSNMREDKENTLRSADQVKVAYPKKDESLVEFLHHCQRKKSKVTLCPRCSSAFDKKAVENIERV